MLVKPWTINCILAGAKVAILMRKGRMDEVRQSLSNLTSGFEPEDIDYLIMRLSELLHLQSGKSKLR